MQLRNTPLAWGEISRALHWITAALIVFQLAYGWWMVTVTERAVRRGHFGWHVSIGYLLLAIVIVRLVWRWLNPTPAPAEGAPVAERLAAHITHLGLYAVMLAMSFTGWALAGTFPQPLDASLLGIAVPAIAEPGDLEVHESLEEWHAGTAWALVILVCVHVLGALFHLLIRKDGVMHRMLPQWLLRARVARQPRT